MNMKRFLYLAALALALFACKKPDSEKPGPDGPDTPEVVDGYDSITATLEKTTSKTAWAKDDAILVYTVTEDGVDIPSKYILTGGEGTNRGTFAPENEEKPALKGGRGYFATYPYNDDLTFAQHNTFAITIPAMKTDATPIFAYAEDAANITFSSILGAIRFTLTGKGNLSAVQLEDANTNCILFGNATFNGKTGKLNIKNGSASKYAINFKFADKVELDETTSDPILLEIPAGTLVEGGTLTLIDMNEMPLATVAIPAQTIVAGQIAEIGNLEFKGKAQTVDLSTSGTANCYIIPDAGSYKFPLVKGFDRTLPVEAVSAEVVWETYNEEEGDVVSGSLISRAYIEDGYMFVETGERFHPGNALVAAKNAAGDIVWSWHLWMPETPVGTVADESYVFTPTAYMDRNVGALIVSPTPTDGVPPIKSYGLYFQWGRKDPFTGPMVVSGAATEPLTGAISLEASVANPTQLPNGSGAGNNWCTEDLQNLWDDGGGKSIYDPCPPGYKVPVYNTDFGLWKRTDEGWTFDLDHQWFRHDATNSTYPAAGYLSGSTNPSNRGKRSVIWSATYSSGERGYDAHINMSSSPQYNYNSYYKYAAGSVRCVAEK